MAKSKSKSPSNVKHSKSRERSESGATRDIKTALRVEYVAASTLKTFANNARTHSAEQIAQIAASIKQFGFVAPLLIDAKTNEIIAGHGRLAAAFECSMVRVPVIRLHDLTQAQCRALRLADNRIAANSGWNFETLDAELRELSKHIDMTAIGFDDVDLQRALKQATDAASASNVDVNEGRFLVLIDCKSEPEQKTLYDELTERGFIAKLP